MTAVEQSTAVPDIQVESYVEIPKTYCPIRQNNCIGEICKFWWADDCIITKSLIKYYNKDRYDSGNY